MEIKLSELRKVKGIGPKAMKRVREHLDKLEGDKAYVSEYDPTMHINANDLVQGDMLEVMNGIPDKSVDMILTDLPYGTTACSWDSVIDFDKLWKQYNRVIKPNGAIVLFGSEPFSSQLRNSNIDNYRYDWVWDKALGTGHLNVKRMPLKRHENVVVFSKEPSAYNPQMVKRNKTRIDTGDGRLISTGTGESAFGKHRNTGGTYTHRYPTSIQRFTNAIRVDKEHPTQKPVALLEYLIKTYTNENEVVLDSTMGSGSTGVASYNTNRRFIGIELDKDYFEIATERIKEFMNE